MTEPAASPAPAFVVHRMPGRLRLRIPSRRGDSGYFRRLVGRLREAAAGKANIVANPATASLLIEGTASLEAAGDLLVVTAPAAARPVTTMLRAGWQRIDAGVARVSRGAVDGADIAVLSLLGLAVLQAVRGQALGPSSNMLWSAYEMVRRMTDNGG